MIRNDSLIETTERFYRLFEQSKKRQINAEKQLQETIANQGTSTTLPHFVDAETKITRLDDSEFIKVQEGVELLSVWGDSQTGPSGIVMRIAPNTFQKVQVNVCFAMVISGVVKHLEAVHTEEEAKLLRAGDSWTQKTGSSLHIESCPTKEATLLYILCDKPIEEVFTISKYFI